MECYERERERERERNKTGDKPYISRSQSATPQLPYQVPLTDPPLTDILSASPSPTPQSIMSSMLGRPKSTKSTNKRRTFQPPLPPLPGNHIMSDDSINDPKTSITAPTSPLLAPTSPLLAHNEEASKSFGIPTPLAMTAIATMNYNPINTHKIRKSAITSKKSKSYKKRRVYRKRSNSNVSYKSFKSRASTYKSQRNASYRNRSDISKSTMCSQHSDILNEEESYNDNIDAVASPMPLSIGDHSQSKIGSTGNGTMKNFTAFPPSNPTMNMNEYSNNTLDLPYNTGNASIISENNKYEMNEEESHDCGMSLLDNINNNNNTNINNLHINARASIGMFFFISYFLDNIDGTCSFIQIMLKNLIIYHVKITDYVFLFLIEYR